jgi:magnesium transporter
VQVETGMTQTDVARLLQRHRYLGLPVVDESQKLVGVISADTVMDAMEQDASDDIAKIVGTGAEEIKTHSVKRIVFLRLPWLAVNFASGIICALISGLFQNDFPTIAFLFLFVPIVLGLSESTGVQGATIIVRNITLGNITFNYLTSLFIREALAGIFIGFSCGVLVGLFAWIWIGKYIVGIALAVSMTLTIIISALIGLLLPLIFQKFRFDPALASGPFVLAVCDIQTLIVYFFVSGSVLCNFAN